MTDNDNISEIRRSVQALCAEFPGAYWREKDSARAYPAEFVDALTKAGFLAALIPESYGGSGLKLDDAAVIMEEIQAAGCNGASAHAQMYIMNTLLKYGSEEQKQEYLPRIATGELRLQAFGVSEPTSGTDTLSLRTVAVRDGDPTVSDLVSKLESDGSRGLCLAHVLPLPGHQRCSGLTCSAFDSAHGCPPEA